MKIRVAHWALVFGLAGAVSVGCGSDDDASTPPKGGAGGLAGSAGKAGSSGKGGSIGDSGSGGMAGEGVAGASAGTDQGGAAGAGGDHGELAGSGPGGEGGEGGEGGGAGAGETHVYTQQQIDRGKVIVRSMALCGGCHTGSGGAELGGNAQFKGGAPAPNLTDDSTGIGDWTDAQVINAFRNGIDNEGRVLHSSMPYWLFHNMNDADALSVVAFMRSLPHALVAVGEANPPGTAVTPLSPSSLPDTTLPPTSPEYAEAQRGKYLVSGVAACVRCHSPATTGQPPVAGFFTGVPNADPTKTFASNITPDLATGIGGWAADDVVKALKEGKNKADASLCPPMPSASRGYGGMSDADAHAIGVYLVTIPAVSSPTTAPSLEPACLVNP